MASFSIPGPGKKTLIGTPPGSADSQWLSELAGTRRLFVITENAADALRIGEEMRWFNPSLRCGHFPDWETLPYDPISPHPDLVSERLATLWRSLEGELDCLIAPLATALQYLPPREFLSAHAFLYQNGQRIDAIALRSRLVAAGYAAVNQVFTPGEFAIRGGVIDLFPSGSVLPYRIELFDDEIESIRTFDPDSQRSLYKVNEIRLLPAREFPLDEIGINHFRGTFRERFEGDPGRRRIYKDVSNGLAPAGIEAWLPLFFDHTATLFDYLGEGTVAVLLGDLPAAAHSFWHDLQERARNLAGDPDRPLLPPAEIYLPEDAFFARLKPLPRILLQNAGESRLFTAPPTIAANRRDEQPYRLLQAHLDGFSGQTWLIAESLGRRETLAHALAEHGIQAELAEGIPTTLARFVLTTGPLAAGYVDTQRHRCVLTEAELYARAFSRKATREVRRTAVEGLLRDLSELRVGDPVVHIEHGIGLYLGLESMDLGIGTEEFLALEYAKGDKLFVPVTQLDLIARYLGADPERVSLSALGSPQWEKARRRALDKARDTAAELLDLYARRAARGGQAFELHASEMDRFAEGFGFEETPDQLATIDAVLADLAAPRAMDRLVCGDVGFGKTEVALRAAFAVALNGRQVAILCPTTLLAEQHFQTFSDRFADTPIRIAELSRFRSTQEINTALKGIAAGGIDIVIGTHKLLQPDIAFARLGLVIIDEEHRFGVRQKESLRKLRAEVDCLALTATPIPRTLAMSLEGIRDFSVIATAPSKRLAIKTFVQPEADSIIREAALRELKRGGQIYFLHNAVETIQNARERLAKLLPEARIGVAHGQMPERELEHVMRDFYHQRFNLLLCTTIIETGINVPTANTILIHRADKFGLAQLHQLRGRVGRSHHQAYAYLLLPGAGESAITPAGKKRLEAIQMMGELGSGFQLAMQDLEIRGAGEILGDSQSGEIDAVGFSLYQSMLDQAVKDLQKSQQSGTDAEPDFNIKSEINLHLPARIPESYCADINERLSLYKRLASAQDATALEALNEELIDRFGLPPDPLKTLLATHRLRLATRRVGIRRLNVSDTGLTAEFVPKPPIDPMRIIQMIQSRRDCKLAGPDKLRIERSCDSLDARVQLVRELLDTLAPSPKKGTS